MHGMQHGYGFIFKRSLPHNCEVKTRYNAHAQVEPPHNVPSQLQINITPPPWIQFKKAVKCLESREVGDNFSYREVAKMFSVNRTTLSQRHRGKQVQEAAKVARQQAKTERERERKQRAEELAAQRALKKLQRDAATAKKTYDTANKCKRKVSHKAAKNLTKRRRVAAASSRVDAGPPAASPPPKYSASQRQVKTPTRYK
ncbi:hypothetical protein PtrM4_143350 [Pyrenophora tritici-repentis]|uniref:Uncharacterized protein n=2 Tax=Pyrenophora tritici-repentis TaxID=45151 RepID=A0A834RWR5_9PLEO|nr:uncharacterized protein PTRG_11824 [Pyrenophora tritici-repentis Pt-1C-BFP]KAF7567744.1 hypothetical protein PtrM4_143350 [Pyrenophora tritici-repentis]EDU45980.1 predicted protein [Pyrenophora tritici-repentis Pt-1C-BFP]KAF7571229.1 hypothetical protein PtrM4_112310 [Pyrenophora tritici-repentis]KAI1507221.1 hypothetical protein Ptr86124_013826 [Pyrenophora tritici-repentis]KAI1507600.1 hypothetical protein Ptr86124_013457 [Pyrenophora tritici-repentis]